MDYKGVKLSTKHLMAFLIFLILIANSYFIASGKYLFSLALMLLVSMIFISLLNEKYLVFILFILYGLQSSRTSLLTVIDISFMRLDLFDLAIVLFLFILFTKVYSEQRKINEEIKVIAFFMIYSLIYGVLKKYDAFNIFYDMRTVLYFIVTYYIFSNIYMEEEALDKILISGGLLSSLYYIYVFLLNYNTSSIILRDVSINLFASLISLYLCLFTMKNKCLLILISLINVFAIILSQTRTIIIPMILTILYYAYANKKKFVKVIYLCLSGLPVVYILSKLDYYNYIFRRFQYDFVFGKYSTLKLRVDSSILNLKGVPLFELLLGSGLGKTVLYYPIPDKLSITNDLEMLLSNMIIKYGMIISLFIIIGLFVSIKKNYSKNNLKLSQNKYFILLIFILSGGLVSGLSGYNGQLLLGLLLGVINNSHINKDKELFTRTSIGVVK